MKNLNGIYSNPKQGFLPVFLSDCLDLLDPVFTFDRFMEGIDLQKYLKNIPRRKTGRLGYNPVNMLKTVLFGFMTNGYCSLRELEDNCKVNLRFMYLMDREKPSYRTFGYFINEILKDSIEDIFAEINRAIGDTGRPPKILDVRAGGKADAGRLSGQSRLPHGHSRRLWSTAQFISV